MRHFTESALNEAKSGVLRLLFIRRFNEQFLKLPIIAMYKLQCFTRKAVPAGTGNVFFQSCARGYGSNGKTAHLRPNQGGAHARHRKVRWRGVDANPQFPFGGLQT